MPKPIRILHVGKFYAPVEGGIENVVQEMVTAFRNDPEISADVLVAQRKGRACVDLVDGVKVHRVHSHGLLLSMPLAPGLPAKVNRLARGYDIVHVHVPNPLPFFCDWQALNRVGTRLVVHFHSDIIHRPQRLALSFLKVHERRFYQAASSIVVTSQNLLQHTAMLQPYQDKCTILPLSIALDSVRPGTADARADTRARLGFCSTDVVFFFLGRLVYYKGVHDLLRAAAQCGAKLLVGGTGPLQPELQALAKSLDATHNITFLGRIPAEQVADIYNAADVFVLPSNAASEAFGVVQLEAMAHGLPVINTLLPTGVPEVSQAGITGLTVPPGDVDALANAMRRMVAEPALRQRFSHAARERVQQYSRPIVMEKLRHLYRNVARQPIREVSTARKLAAHSSSGTASIPVRF